MAQHWPPSPSVEDECTSLAREQVVDLLTHETRADDQPAATRGAVDQTPVLLAAHEVQPDTEYTIRPGKDKVLPQDVVRPKSRDNSASTPPIVTNQREVNDYFQHPVTKEEDHRSSSNRSRPTEGFGSEDTQRGRPQVTRIHTDLGSDLQGMVTGQRRDPSPYSYKPAATNVTAPPISRFSGENFLSPSHATPSPRNADGRHSSTIPSRNRKQGNDYGSSTDSDGRRRPSRHRSKSRPSRRTVPLASREVPDGIVSEKASPKHSTSRVEVGVSAAADRPSASSKSYYRQGNITPPRSRKNSNQPPYASTAEELRSMRYSTQEKNTHDSAVYESPYTSSNEESRLRRRERPEDLNYDHGRSHRASTRRSERQGQDSERERPSSSEHESFFGRRPSRHRSRPRQDLPSPVSSRTPRVIEDYIETAFRENQRKRSDRAAGSPANLFLANSAPVSPPRSPCVERNPKDYFGTNTADDKIATRRTRPSSGNSDQVTDMRFATGLFSAAVAGAASAVKARPDLTRSSTTSFETVSSGVQSRISSGQQSGRPSPVHEEPRYTSRTVPMAERPPLSAWTSSPQDLQPPLRTTSYVVPSSHHNSTPARAFSYSSTYEQAYQRPSSSYASPGATVTSARSPIQASHTTPTAAQRQHTSFHNSLEMVPLAFSIGSCPRSVSRAGLHDWYTMKGKEYLDICPSCMRSMGASPFRDYFVPSLPKPHGQTVSCAMSRPWYRVAFEQSVRQNRINLNLLDEISHPPSEIWPCNGRKAEARKWWHIEDPDTRKQVENFDICTECAYKLDKLFPETRTLPYKLFVRPDNELVREKICNLNTDSKHFAGIIEQVERLANRCRDGDPRKKPSAFRSFVSHIAKAARYPECMKDSMLPTRAWHFMPRLPEFTICQECFAEVVWPIFREPLAEEICRTVQVVPFRNNRQHVYGISCQLYSDRMRNIFRKAVDSADFAMLREAVLDRYRVEQHVQETHRTLLLSQQRGGYARSADVEQNLTLWRSYE